MSDQDHTDIKGRVVNLRGGRSWSGPPKTDDDGLKKFRQPEEPEDDYRQRMITNGIALAFIVFLIVAGIWIADTMASMRKNQDCVLSGRRGCTPVDTPQGQRW